MAEFARLEQSLRELGEQVEWPATPNLSAGVRSRLQPRPARLPQWRWALAAAAAIVLAVAGVLAASPSARQTVAGWLGIRGVGIEHVETVTTPSARPSGSYGEKLGLGSPSRLDGVSDRALARVPSRLGSPDEVYLRDLGGGVTAVSLVYKPSADLPADPNTGAGALVVEIRASLNSNTFVKGVGPGTTLQQVQVRGTTGYWISGAPHLFIILSPGGGDDTRLSGNVLIWTENGVTYRIESNLTQQQALAVAESMR